MKNRMQTRLLLSGFKILLFSFLAMTLIGTNGCKGKKKLAEQQAAEALAKKNAALSSLNALLDRTAKDYQDLAEMEAELESIKAQNIDDSQVLITIKKVEYHLQQERERLDREAAAEQEAQNQQENQGGQSPDMVSTLQSHFESISNAGNAQIANARIEQALDLFSSDDALVLIIISKSGGSVDYDRPTNIRKYLNYLKDVKRAPDAVENIVFDDYGRIKELELIKR